MYETGDKCSSHWALAHICNPIIHTPSIWKFLSPSILAFSKQVAFILEGEAEDKSRGVKPEKKGFERHLHTSNWNSFQIFCLGLFIIKIHVCPKPLVLEWKYCNSNKRIRENDWRNALVISQKTELHLSTLQKYYNWKTTRAQRSFSRLRPSTLFIKLDEAQWAQISKTLNKGTLVSKYSKLFYLFNVILP